MACFRGPGLSGRTAPWREAPPFSGGLQLVGNGSSGYIHPLVRIVQSLTPIHRSAWNRNSANFAFIEFYEVRVLGILGSSHSSPVHYPVRVLWPLTLLRQGHHRASSICTKTLQEVLRGARR